MKRPVALRSLSFCGRDRRSRLCRPVALSAGYTLVEILVATTLALLLMGAVVRIFGEVGQSITTSRSMLESAERLRLVQMRLQQDLAGITVTMNPPRKPENNEGYFEYVEGPITQANASNYAVNTDNGGAPDTTIGDFDDILMFTTRSTGRPFVGRLSGVNTTQSDVAEVAWFLRGRTLHRRVLLVAPAVGPWAPPAFSTFYANNDVSVHRDNATGMVVANTLGDLTRRECRYAHDSSAAAPFPFRTTNWGWSLGSVTIPTLPTLNECSISPVWLLNKPPAPVHAALTNIDFWTNVSTMRVGDNAANNGTDGTRVADDVILTNVIGFDVKAWDPAKAGGAAYVDLGYGNHEYRAIYANSLLHFGHQKSQLEVADNTEARVYDTFSSHYEDVGIGGGGAGTPGQATNGFDDDGNGIVDDIVYNGAPGDGENLTAPPYPVPLRGIQVKIRVFEPDSRQIREVTVVQEFLPQ